MGTEGIARKTAETHLTRGITRLLDLLAENRTTPSWTVPLGELCKLARRAGFRAIDEVDEEDGRVQLFFSTDDWITGDPTQVMTVYFSCQSHGHRFHESVLPERLRHRVALEVPDWLAFNVLAVGAGR
jgi:hypothetical protein